MDLYLQRRDRLPGKGSPEIAALSALLIRLHGILGTKGKSTLRNTNGVYMKLMNFRRLDPEVTATGRTGLRSGSDLEAEIWQEFSSDLPRLHRVAEAIARTIRETVAGDARGGIAAGQEEISDDEEGAEGRLLTRAHRFRERDRKLVAKKKDQVFKRHGRLVCEVCAFNFQDRYGLHGAGFIECHHTKPLETLNAGSTTKLADLALLCANCHRMIHARRPWLSLDQLRALFTPAR
jgi:5-methylcytosine-specific restriction protein A